VRGWKWDRAGSAPRRERWDSGELKRSAVLAPPLAAIYTVRGGEPGFEKGTELELRTAVPRRERRDLK